MLVSMGILVTVKVQLTHRRPVSIPNHTTSVSAFSLLQSPISQASRHIKVSAMCPTSLFGDGRPSRQSRVFDSM